MRKIFMIALVFQFIFLTAAHAQSFTNEGAEKIKAEIDKWLQTQMELIEMSAASEDMQDVYDPVSIEGSTEVRVENGYYAADLPFMVFAPAPDRRIEVGRLAMNIVPEDDSPEIWNMTLAMPKNMPVTNNAGANVGFLKIGSQRFKGRLDTSRDIFLQYEAAYKNIHGEETNDGIVSVLKVADVKAAQNLLPMVDNPELYSGPINFEASGITASQSGKDGVDVKIGKIDGSTVYAQIPLFDAEKFQNEVLEYNGNTSAQADHDLVKSIFETFRFMPDNAKSQFTMSDIQVVSNDEDGKTGMSAQSVQFGSFGNGLKSDDANMGVNYKINGLTFSGMPENYAPYLPNLSQFNAEISSLPLMSVLKLLQAGTMGALDQSKDLTAEQRDKMMSNSIMMIAPLLAKHGTTLSIKDSKTVAPEFAMTMGGDIKASGASPRGFIGDLTIKIQGFDDAVNALRQTMMQNEESRIFLQQVVLGLTMVQSVGDLDETQKIRTYRFDFKENGDIFVNGTNFGAFMGSMAH